MWLDASFVQNRSRGIFTGIQFALCDFNPVIYLQIYCGDPQSGLNTISGVLVSLSNSNFLQHKKVIMDNKSIIITPLITPRCQHSKCRKQYKTSLFRHNKGLEIASSRLTFNFNIVANDNITRPLEAALIQTLSWKHVRYKQTFCHNSRPSKILKDKKPAES